MAEDRPLTWEENFNVKKKQIIDRVNRLDIVVGINEYKGSHLVFLAKVTNKGFSRQFTSLPAYVWEKAIPIIAGMSGEIATVERESMANAVLVELKRLKDLGVDVKALMEKL